eukprot:1175957-Prorocentrum_minimum.AAC.1
MMLHCVVAVTNQPTDRGVPHLPLRLDVHEAGGHARGPLRGGGPTRGDSAVGAGAYAPKTLMPQKPKHKT